VNGRKVMVKALEKLAKHLRKHLKQKIEDAQIEFGELNLRVHREHILAVLQFLRDDEACQFICLIDISGADYPAREERFDIIYHLLSPRHNLRVRLQVATDEAHDVPSACALYAGAEWYERETYDMYGVLFSGHPDLRRILTDYGFEGHPLRKDFPVTGFVECRYDNEAKRVVYEPVLLRQEMRNFDFTSPWEGTDYVLPGDEKAKTGN